jgi:hypothetical protein
MKLPQQKATRASAQQRPAYTGGRSTTFWGEIAPSQHIVQLYEDDRVVLDSLEGFVAGGLDAGEGVIIIATATHLTALADRLTGRGIDVSFARDRDQYLALDAEEILTKFMVEGWPDQELFEAVVIGLIARARGSQGRRVRAFGEMVAVMWAQGLNGATVHLEHLWHALCHQQGFSLFCAYPKSGFTQNAEESIRQICDAHSRVLAS